MELCWVYDYQKFELNENLENLSTGLLVLKNSLGLEFYRIGVTKVKSWLQIIEHSRNI